MIRNETKVKQEWKVAPQVENPISDKIITKDRRQCIALRWLQNAIGSEDRPQLNGIYKNSELVSADGFRMHIHRPNTFLMEDKEEYKVGQQLAEGINKIREGKTIHKTPNRVYGRRTIEGVFPDYKQIIPNRLPWASVTLNKKYLVEAIDDMPTKDTKQIVISLYGPEHPIKIEGENLNGESLAVLMPMDDDVFGGKRAKAIKRKREVMEKAVNAMGYIRDNYPNIYQEAVNQA